MSSFSSGGGANPSRVALLRPHRWRLAGAVALAVVPALLASVVIDLVWTGGGVAVVNGAIVTVGPEWPASVVGLVLLVLGWSVAITAGAVVAIGALRGVPVGPLQALIATGRRLPALALIMAILVGASLLLTFVLTAVSAGAGVLGIILLLAGLVAIGVLACRVLLGLPRLILEPARDVAGQTMPLTARRVVSTAGLLLGVGFLAPWLATVVLASIGSAITRNVVLDGPAGTLFAAVLLAAGHAWLVVVVAVQAAALAVVYLMPRLGEVRAADVDLDDVDVHLRSIGGHGTRRPLRGLPVLFIAPALLAGGVALWNPYGAVHAQSYATESLSSIRDAEWPAVRPPVYAGEQVIYDCIDQACRSIEARLSEGEWMGWDDAVALDPLGNLITATATGDDIATRYCDLDGQCRQAVVALSRDAPHGLGEPLVAVAMAADGVVWLAMATDLAEREDDEADPANEPSEIELALVRCTDWTCGQSHRTELGVVEAWPFDDVDPFDEPWPEPWDTDWGAGWEDDSRDLDTPRLSVEVDGDGRPLVAFRNINELWLGDCEPADCTMPQLERHTSLGYLSVPLGGIGDGALGWTSSGQLRRCVDERCADGWVPEVPTASMLGERAVQVTKHGLLLVVAQPVPETGLHISLGEGADLPKQWLSMLVRCVDLLCAASERYPLGYLDDLPHESVLLVHDDGRVVVRHGTSSGAWSITLRLPDS